MSVPAAECISPFGQECGCAHHNGVCWPRPLTACCKALTPAPDAPPERLALIEQVMRLANEILHAFSGRQFGLCPVTFRPCRDNCVQESRIVWDYSSGGGLAMPMLDGGQWFNNVCGTCVTDCSCTEVCEITLPGPIEAVVEVVQDGVVLDPNQYRVDNHRKLVRLPLVREASGVFAACVPPIPNAICLATPSGDQMQVGGNAFDISPDGQEFTLLTGIPFSVVFGRGRQSPQVKMRLCPGAVVSWTNAVAVSVTSDATLAAQSLTGLTVGAVQTNVTITFPSAVLPSDTMTPDFTILGPPGCGRMDIGAASYLAAGSACWPTCQDMTKGLDETNTLGVTVLRGTPVPEFGRWAAGLLACQLIKVCGLEDDECCVLPANVQSIVREGVSMDLSPLGINGDGTSEFGRTGIPEVDLWLAAVNPHKVIAASRAYSVDRPMPRSTTWPCSND